MAQPTEYKTVQARILQYAQEIGWTFVPRVEAEKRRGFSPHPNPLPEGEGMKREVDGMRWQRIGTPSTENGRGLG